MDGPATFGGQKKRDHRCTFGKSFLRCRLGLGSMVWRSACDVGSLSSGRTPWYLFLVMVIDHGPSISCYVVLGKINWKGQNEGIGEKQSHLVTSSYPQNSSFQCFLYFVNALSLIASIVLIRFFFSWEPDKDYFII